MLAVDVAILGVAAGLAVWGFRHGLSLEMLLVAAFAVGAVTGSRVAPLILDDGLESTYAPAVALPGALITNLTHSDSVLPP